MRESRIMLHSSRRQTVCVCVFGGWKSGCQQHPSWSTTLLFFFKRSARLFKNCGTTVAQSAVSGAANPANCKAAVVVHCLTWTKHATVWSQKLGGKTTRVPLPEVLQGTWTVWKDPLSSIWTRNSSDSPLNTLAKAVSSTSGLGFIVTSDWRVFRKSESLDSSHSNVWTVRRRAGSSMSRS